MDAETIAKIQQELAFVPLPEGLTDEMFNDYAAREGQNLYLNIEGGIVIQKGDEQEYASLVTSAAAFFKDED